MRSLFSSKVKSFSKDEKGATMMEYAILIGVIALVAIVGATTFGGNLSTAFANFGAKVTAIPNQN
jgi:pilus assembly protein Flp/PilA